tara:strand:- start:1434 stop:2123 length:690 start_codon:yes stop_codon:yes gene_type:complete
MIKLKDLLTEAKGDCYQAGGRLIMNFFGDKNHKLVHGMVNGQGALEGKRYGHCWVESSNSVLDHSNGRKLEVPKKVYYALGRVKPSQCKYYTPEQAAKFMVDKGHWGPWEMSGGVVMAEDIPDVRGEVGKRRVRISNNILAKLIDIEENVAPNHDGKAAPYGSGYKKVDEVEENYKDGKKKGKSRPGRVKRSGASCKGSVTSLRAKAKKYGGEKGKMYHWCANMKGGKK